MKVVRWGAQSAAYKALLRNPKKEDYERLVRACIEALIIHEQDVLVKFPYTLKFPKGFPKGILEEKVEHWNLHRIKAKSLLAWLRERGYTDVTTGMLRTQQVAFTKTTQSFLQIGEDEFDFDERQEQP